MLRFRRAFQLTAAIYLWLAGDEATFLFWLSQGWPGSSVMEAKGKVKHNFHVQSGLLRLLG